MGVFQSAGDKHFRLIAAVLTFTYLLKMFFPFDHLLLLLDKIRKKDELKRAIKTGNIFIFKNYYDGKDFKSQGRKS